MPDKKWQSAKSTKIILSAIFRVARATLVNAAFMSSVEAGAGYKSMVALDSLLPEEECKGEEEDEGVHLAQTGSQTDEESASNIEDFDAGDFNLGQAKATAVKGDKAILEDVKSLSQSQRDVNCNFGIPGSLKNIHCSSISTTLHLSVDV